MPRARRDRCAGALLALLVVTGCSNPGSQAPVATQVPGSAARSGDAPASAAPPPAAPTPPAPAPAPKLAAQTIAADLAVLRSSRDRAALERAAVELAGSGDPAAIGPLGDLLRRAEFLARLDDVKSPPESTQHLRRVVLALAERPTPETGALCVRLLADPVFLADPDRAIFVLDALAAVRPMSEEAAAAFRKTNAEGHFSANLPRLAQNGSPRALALFEEMVRDKGQSAASRVADIHAAVLPHRTDPGLLRSIDRLLASPDLEDPIAAGLIETVFDNQGPRWFGKARTPPAPPPWESASREVLDLVLALADRARARKGLPAALLEAVDRTAAAVRAARGSR